MSRDVEARGSTGASVPRLPHTLWEAHVEPKGMRTGKTGGPAPSQIRAAERWLRDRRLRQHSVASPWHGGPGSIATPPNRKIRESTSHPMFTATKDKALLTTTTGALPRPSWYTANLRGMPLSQGFSQLAYREQHFDCLACHVADAASRRHRHLRRRRHAARRRRRGPQLGELRDRAHERHRQAARRGAARRLHEGQGAGRHHVGGDRDPHDAAGRAARSTRPGSSSTAPTRRSRR